LIGGIELRVFGKECEVQDADLQNRPNVSFKHCFYSEKDYNKEEKINTFIVFTP